MSVTIVCEKCGRIFPIDCEQAEAIRRRGKCIACLCKANETFTLEPYEFEVKGKGE